MERENVCLTTEGDLTAYHQGELSPERAAVVEAHLESCDACRRALAGVRSVFSMAGTVEDIVPSLRFKRNVERMIERNRVRETEPIGERIRLAVAYLVDRLRTSPRFRFAAVSVAVNAGVLLLASLVVIPAVAKRGPAEFVIDPDSIEQLARQETGPFESAPDEPRPLDGVEPLPEPSRETGVFRELPPEMVSLDPLLPPAEPMARLPGVIFANVISPDRKRRALAAAFAEPQAALAAVDRGLAWLAKNQKADGSWPISARGRGYEPGVTAAALLAFLSDGHSETRGREEYRAVVTRGLNWLLARQQKKGDLAGLVGSSADGVHYTYNHALATIVMVEAASLDQRRVPEARSREVRAAVRQAVSFIVKCQTPDGGWKYQLQSGGPQGFENDTSVSIFMVTALTAARSARFQVPEKSFRGFARWLRDVTGESGVVGYARAGDRDEHPRTLTAGALFLEERLGLAAPLRERQAKLVRAELTDADGSTSRNCLLRFFSSLAFRLRGEPVLHTFGVDLLERQGTDGAWRVSDKPGATDLWAVYGGDAFLTAMNVLTLTTSYRAGA